MTKAELRELKEKEAKEQMVEKIIHDGETYDYCEDQICRNCGEATIYGVARDMYMSHICVNNKCKDIDYIETWDRKGKHDFHFFFPINQKGAKAKITITLTTPQLFKKNYETILNKFSELEIYDWQRENVEKLFNFKVIGKGSEGKLRIQRIGEEDNYEKKI